MLFIFTPLSYVLACDLTHYNALNCDPEVVFYIQDYQGDLDNANVLSTVDVSYNGFSFNVADGSFAFTDLAINNYKGFGTATVELIIGGQICEVTVKFGECCNPDPYDYLFIDEEIAGGSYSGTIFMYGDIEFTGNTNFASAEVLNAPDAKLILVDVVQVEAYYSLFSLLCEYAWDGFYLNNSGNSLILDNSTIEEAIRAVQTNLNGQVQAIESTFQNNIVSMHVQDHTGQGPYNSSYIVLSGNTFTFTRDMGPFSDMVHPSSPIDASAFFTNNCQDVGSGYSIHIRVDGSESVNIGHSSYMVNFFRNPGVTARAGDIDHILSVNSQVFIRNNIITDPGINVCATEESRVILGGSGTGDGNELEYGASILNSAAHIEDNEFYSASGPSAVHIESPFHTTVATGYNAGTNIINNQFTDGRLDVVGNFQATQVRVIDNLFDGSYARIENLHGTANGRVIFNDNTMSNSPIGTQLRVYQCDEIVIGNNTLSHTNPTNTSGIYLDVVQNALEVTQNNISGYTYGMYVTNGCLGTQITCNTFSNNDYGVYLDDADISDQGSSAEGNNNQWNSNTIDIDGNAFWPVDWFYNAASLTNNAVNVSEFATGMANPCNTPSYFSVAKPADNSQFTEAQAQLQSLGRDNLNENLLLKIYPNPVTDQLSLIAPEEFHSQQIHIYNSNGQVVESFILKRGETTISLSHLPSGLYMLQIGEQQHRLIKK